MRLLRGACLEFPYLVPERGRILESLLFYGLLELLFEHPELFRQLAHAHRAGGDLSDVCWAFLNVLHQ